MPRILITETLGRNIVQGQLKNLPATTIAQISAEYGDGWYTAADPHAAARFRRGEVKAAQGRDARRQRRQSKETA